MNFDLRYPVWSSFLALGLGVLPVLAWASQSAAPGWQALPAGQQVLSPNEQGGLVLAVYGFKSVYMLLALAALALIWDEVGPAWRTLQASLAAFWLGEFFCGINILFYFEESLVFEYLHSLFMTFCLGLLFYSVMEAVDANILHYSNPRERCALAGNCKNCVKGQPAHASACLLRKLFQWMMPLTAVLAGMPLMAQALNFSFVTSVFGSPRLLTHLISIQWYELRFTPAAALALLAAAWLALVWKGNSPTGLQISKILLSAAVGQLGFSLMRLSFAAYSRAQLVWFVFWEELTELLLICAVLILVSLTRPGKLWGRIVGWFG